MDVFITIIIVVSVVVFLYYLNKLSKVTIKKTLKAKLETTWGIEVLYEVYPSYRYLDICRAADSFAEDADEFEKIESSHDACLSDILNFGIANDEELQKSNMMPKNVSHNQQQLVHMDNFWYVKYQGKKYIIRVKVHPFHDLTQVEIATFDIAEGKTFREALLDRSVQLSIYRNQVIELDINGEQVEDYGEFSNERLGIKFLETKNITDEDIIMDPDIARVIQRNVIDFHIHRKLLLAKGIPSKKGLLFYGPPGTGKTYTCQWLYNKAQFSQ